MADLPLLREAAKRAEKALQGAVSWLEGWAEVGSAKPHYDEAVAAIASLRSALAQKEDGELKPVAQRDGQPIKRWRFRVEDIDGNGASLDAEGGPDGDERAAEFVGTSAEAAEEGDRRAELWESRTGAMVMKIVRESYGPPPSQGNDK